MPKGVEHNKQDEEALAEIADAEFSDAERR